MTDDERLRNMRAKLTHRVSLSILELIDRKYPDTHPEIIANALADTMASMIVLFSNSEATAMQGAERGAETLKRAVTATYATRTKHFRRTLH
jgi:hypothetical protein